MHGLAQALSWAATIGHVERNPAEVERCASDLIELSTRQNLAFWLAMGAVYRSWARSASSSTAEGIAWIEDGIRDYRTTGSILRMPYFLALKAEPLHFADRVSEALEAIWEAKALVERSEERWWCPNYAGSAVCFSRLWAPTRFKLRLHSAKPSESHGSRSRFHSRNEQKQPTRNTAAKKGAGQEGVGSDYLFGNFLQLPTFRFAAPPANPSPFFVELPDSSNRTFFG